MFSRYPAKSLAIILPLNLFLNTAYAQPAKILVSIKPLHSLISNITIGINKTELLLNQQQSAHHFQLRPSQKRKINQADLFFYSSDTIESFVPALRNTTKNLEFIQLVDSPGINLLKTRSIDSISSHITTTDGHIWLSIENARQISQYVTNILTRRNPKYADHYQQNLKNLIQKLEILQKSNSRLLSEINNKPYLVYHDAYQYFEKENNLNKAFFATSSPEHKPGIKRLKELKRLVADKNIQCAFYEPPNIPSFLKILSTSSSIQLATIEPMGTKIPQGIQHYFQLMQLTATTLYECLTGNK